MNERLKAAVPLAISVAAFSVLWIEVAANFTFHWSAAGDLGNGLGLPDSLHAVLPAAFVSWAMFFAAGGDRRAAVRVAIASVVGCVGALILFVVLDASGGLPDFWVLALVASGLALLVVLASAAGDWYFVPGIFGAFASALFWWIATGMDGWAPGGGGSDSVESLGDVSTAGTGAFGGVLSTTYGWVAFDVAVSLLIGCLLGLASVSLAGAMSSRRHSPTPEVADI